MSKPDTCPTCGHTLVRGIASGRRICALCGLKIGKRHKYTHGSDGRCQHRNCQNPTGTATTEIAGDLFVATK